VLPVKRKNSRLDNTVKAGEARLTCLDVTTIYIYILSVDADLHPISVEASDLT
jgi:hypothetical protein